MKKFRKTMTLNGVIECLPTMRRLAKAKSRSEIEKILSSAPNCVVYAISEITRNTLNGNIPLSVKRKNQLGQYKEHLRELGKKSITLKRRRKILNQVGGGLPALLIPAISVLSSLIIDQVKK